MTARQNRRCLWRYLPSMGENGMCLEFSKQEIGKIHDIIEQLKIAVVFEELNDR